MTDLFGKKPLCTTAPAVWSTARSRRWSTVVSTAESLAHSRRRRRQRGGEEECTTGR